MSKRDALRGYLLQMAVDADDPLGLSSEDLHEVFASDYPKFEDFDDAFANALIWLRDESFVRFHSLPSGTNGEGTVVDLVASKRGEEASRAAASAIPAIKERSGLSLTIAGLLGRFIGEWQNTQT